MGRDFHLIDAVVSNAGWVGKVEEMLHVNYFGPWLMFHLLSPYFKDQCRVVHVGSDSHEVARYDKKDVFLKRFADVSSWDLVSVLRAYATTKLMISMAIVEFSEREKRKGVTYHVVQPGCLNTRMGENGDHFLITIWATRLMKWLFFKSPWEGAQTVIHVATDPFIGNHIPWANNAKWKFWNSQIEDVKLRHHLWKITSSVCDV